MSEVEAFARRIDSLSEAFAVRLRAWQERFFRAEMRRALRDPRQYVRQAKAVATPEDELRELLLRFGIRRTAEAADVQPGALVTDAIAGKPIKISFFQRLVRQLETRAADIAESHREQIRESVRQILADAAAQPVRPTLNEVIRRIARTVHAVAPEDGASGTDRVYAFSWERAALIARTEMAQAENTGKVEGFRSTGWTAMMWLSYIDGKSGDRHHERLNKTVRKIGDTWTDGLGNELRWPGDPMAPIASTANCRCTVRPVRD